MIGGLNMRRALLIARRDYLGYIKTWGFWISFCLPFLFGILGVAASQMNIDLEPVRYEAILDDTGGAHKAGITARYEYNYTKRARAQIDKIAEIALSESEANKIDTLIDEKGIEAMVAELNEKAIGNSLKLPKRSLVFVEPPLENIEALKAFMKAGKTVTLDGDDVVLNGVLHIRSVDGTGKVMVDYWSPQINAQDMKKLARSYFKNLSEREYLETGALSQEGLEHSRKNALSLQSYNPSKVSDGGTGGQEVTMLDRIPYLVAAIMAMVLWLTVFSGAYMLLTSMLEEKLKKLLEMMLASTRFGEIILGKLIGVAALTMTAMLPYIVLGIGAVVLTIFMGPTDVSIALKAAFTWKMMVFFPVFLILGYIFYGSLFIAMGALAESMQDAQTITTPIVMVLTLCVLVVPLGLNSPDSPLLVFASWFPLSAPFAAISRLPSDPPLWELVLSASFLALLSIGVVILAGRIFRYGVLSGAGIKGFSAWFKRVILRQKPKQL